MLIGARGNPFLGHLESTGALVSNLTARGDRDGQGLVGVMEHGRLVNVTLESVDIEESPDCQTPSDSAAGASVYWSGKMADY